MNSLKVNWVVEKYMFENYEEHLVQVIKDTGHNCLLVDDTNLKFDFDVEIKNKFKKNDCVLFYGSLQRGRQMLRDTPYIPGVFLTIDNYECYRYYKHYGNELVNNDYCLFSLGDLFRDVIRQHIFEFFVTTKVFVRPSNGYKTFTGQLISKENWVEELDVLCKSYGGLDLDTLVLVADRQRIREENRFIVVNENGKNRIIDGNTYMIDQIPVNVRLVDEKALEYANTIVNNYTPDPAFTVDIAKMDGGQYKILEIGSFCCAGWYNANLPLVVDEINKLVINEYNNYYNIL